MNATDYLKKCAASYKQELMTDIMPFWLEHGLDPVYGGVYTCLDREGNLMDTTKSVWFQGRFGFIAAYAYNLIEVCYYSNDDKTITLDKLKNMNAKININHDKDEDDYYDLLSAFQKSIRGSDVNAAIYYLAKLLEGNEIEAVCRRLTVIAYEDIGLANPSMGPKVHAAVKAVERLGLPEGRIPLSSVVIELALSPKSNSAETAIDLAFNDINSFNTGKVPNHIKNGSKDYKYPHNYKNNFVH